MASLAHQRNRKLSTKMRKKFLPDSVWLVVIFGLNLIILSWMFGGHESSSVYLSCAYLLVAAVIHAIMIDDRIFSANQFEPVNRYTKEATVFGLRFTAPLGPKLWGQPSLRGLVVRMTSSVAIYLYFVQLSSNQEIDRSGLVFGSVISGVAIFFAINNRFVWIPASIMFLSYLLAAKASKSHVLNLLSIVMGITVFSIYAATVSRMTKQTVTEHASPNDLERIKLARAVWPQLRKILVISVIAYIGIGLLDAPSQKKKTPTPKTIEHASQSSSMDTAKSSKSNVSTVVSQSRATKALGEGDGIVNLKNSFDHSGRQDGAKQSASPQEDLGSSESSSNGKMAPLESPYSGPSGTATEPSRDENTTGQSLDSQSSAGGISEKQRFSDTVRRNTNQFPKFTFKPQNPRYIFMILIGVSLFILFFSLLRKRKQQPPNGNESKVHRREQLKREIVQDLSARGGGLWSGAYSKEAMSTRIINLYNQWLELNATSGLEKPASMTPDEYYYYFIARAPQKSHAVRTVTDIFSRVYFGNEPPDEESWIRYCQALKNCM